jgi:hypothetical protein
MREMTFGAQASNLDILAFIFKGSISNPFTPYSLNIIGLLLIESLSMLVLLSGYRAFAEREGQIMSHVREFTGAGRKMLDEGLDASNLLRFTRCEPFVPITHSLPCYRYPSDHSVGARFRSVSVAPTQ